MLLKAMMADPDPAAAAYRYGKTHPAIEQRLDALKSARLVSELDKNNKGTSKLSQEQVLIADSANQATEREKLESMSESELLKLVQE